MRIVAKFGGTSIDNGELVRKAAQSVAKEVREGHEVAVVVSAMGQNTDTLLENAASTGADKKALDDILSMGERTSARMMAAALRVAGASARYFDPADADWPVITDNCFGNAVVVDDATSANVRKHVEPLLRKGIVPVICGFLGKTVDGEITTLGRGGSDITALLLGRYLNADEVVVVKDVEGVMSGDPSKLGKTTLLERIEVEKLKSLALGGAQVLHPRALDYKDPDLRVRIIHYRHGDLQAKGTEVIGPKAREEGVLLHPKQLGSVTVVGDSIRNTPGVLARFSAALFENGINVYCVSIGGSSISFYVDAERTEDARRACHEVMAGDGKYTAVSVKKGIALVLTASKEFIETPGVIARITAPLAEKKINILDISSSLDSIMLLVDWEQRQNALALVKKSVAKR
jgi:aspartate kinase